MKLSPSVGPLLRVSLLLAGGLLLGACATGTPTSAPPGRQPHPTGAPTMVPTRATTTTSAQTSGQASGQTSGPATATTATPSDDSSAPATPTAVSSSADPGPDAAKAAESWADNLFAGKSADACALMDGAATQQIIGYAQKADPTVHNCGDAALALFQQADMQGTAYAKATAKPTGQASGSVTFTLTYTEGRRPEKVTLAQQDDGWLVDDYRPAS